MTISSFTFYEQQQTLTKVAQFFKIYCHLQFQDSRLISTPISHLTGLCKSHVVIIDCKELKTTELGWPLKA
jgi:hypothetical protein